MDFPLSPAGFHLSIQDKNKSKKMPVLVMFMAVFFNFVNSYTNGKYLGEIPGGYNITWLSSPFFIIGIFLFFSGMIINKRADYQLQKLRSAVDTGYKIPYGGMFKFISSPNYFGEIVEWIGFAVLCRNLPALAFCIWTIANLLPRAISHHRWYKNTFKDYPADRKALIPFIL